VKFLDIEKPTTWWTVCTTPVLFTLDINFLRTKN